MRRQSARKDNRCKYRQYVAIAENVCLKVYWVDVLLAHFFSHFISMRNSVIFIKVSVYLLLILSIPTTKLAFLKIFLLLLRLFSGLFVISKEPLSDSQKKQTSQHQTHTHLAGTNVIKYVCSLTDVCGYAGSAIATIIRFKSSSIKLERMNIRQICNIEVFSKLQ